MSRAKSLRISDQYSAVFITRSRKRRQTKESDLLSSLNSWLKDWIMRLTTSSERFAKPCLLETWMILLSRTLRRLVAVWLSSESRPLIRASWPASVFRSEIQLRICGALSNCRGSCSLSKIAGQHKQMVIKDKHTNSLQHHTTSKQLSIRQNPILLLGRRQLREPPLLEDRAESVGMLRHLRWSLQFRP